jgi:transposase-like protein
VSVIVEEDFKRWTAKRKAALVTEILQGKTIVSEASRAHDLPPSEIEGWVDEGKKGLENALRAKPLDIKEQYERQLRELQEAYGEAMLELRPCRPKAQSGAHNKKPCMVRGSERPRSPLSRFEGLVLAEQKRFEWSLPNLFQMD